jgi:6-phosphogluconolactonase
VFALEGGGRLVPKGHVAAGGKTPRHFAIDESGRWLLVANQASDGVAVFRLDAASGRPTFTGSMVRVPKPVCTLVVPAGSR